MNKVKQISYTVIANLLSMLISMLITFFLPKVLGVTDYSYFQLYLFYFSYVGILHFGWADGVFLRYGGAYYEKLDKGTLKSQFVLFFFLQVAISIILAVGLFMTGIAMDKKVVLMFTCFSILVTNFRTLLQYILQATNRIKEYAVLVVVEKITYISIVFSLIVAGEKNYVIYIMANIIGLVVANVYGLYQCKEILQAAKIEKEQARRETKKNLKVGIQLMLANLASQLIVGIVRQAIEMKWSVEQFGKVSLSLSISNMLLVFINAVAIVLFPMLRRMKKDELVPMYKKIRSLLCIPLFLMLVCYYPIKIILTLWLPEYTESLTYLAILFPICIFESKMSMLIGTYLKTLRKEMIIMKVNIITVFMSLLFAGITVFLLENMTLAIGSIVILLAFRSVLSEYFLSKQLQVLVFKDILVEIMLVIVFILSSWFVGGWIGTVIYTLCCGAYCYWKKNDILEIVYGLRRKIK